MPPWSGGSFTRSHDWTSDEGLAIDIEAARMDQEDDNFATGINACLTKDGSNSPSGNLPLGGNKHTGVGNASARDQYASAADVQDQDLIYFVDSGSANTYVLTPAPSIGAYEEGQRLVFRATNDNTGASTLNVNGLGAKAIQTNAGVALSANMIVAGGYYEVTYDGQGGTRFVLTSPHSLAGPLLAANNSFTGENTIASATPYLFWYETDAATDEKYWNWQSSAGDFALITRSDAAALGDQPIVLTRTGTTVDSIVLTATAITITGAATFSVQPIFASKGAIPYYDSATHTSGKINVSTDAASGTPAAGELWFQYTA